MFAGRDGGLIRDSNDIQLDSTSAVFQRDFMKTFRTTLALFVLALSPVLAGSEKVIDKDGCVRGEPCKCMGCGNICGSDACKVSTACKDDACSKS